MEKETEGRKKEKGKKEERRKRESRLLFFAECVPGAAAVLSGSISVPLLFRGFYYAHIPGIVSSGAGYNAAEIREAFDEVMDYCMGLRDDFSAGMLPFSSSGASHFADVRKLFILDIAVLVLSIVILAAVFFLSRRKGINPARPRGHGPGFWAAAGLGTVFIIIGALAVLDFNFVFTLMHAILFPGKTNWIFDWRTDPVILILPETFFRDCGILILAVLLICCAVLIAIDFRISRRGKGSSANVK